MKTKEKAICQICGEPLPEGEEMFNYHGYSCPCPKIPSKQATSMKTKEEIYKGQKLKPVHDSVDYEDSIAEVVRYSNKQKKWYIVEDNNFGRWCDEETIKKEYVEINIKK